MKRLLTIGHSYVVAANRALAHQMAVQGRGEWEVTAVAPSHFRGDLRPIAAEPIAGEACALETVPVRLAGVPHVMWFGGPTRTLLARDWDVVHCWEEPYTFAASRIARALSPRATFVVASFQNLSKSYPWPVSAFERSTMARAGGWIAFGETVRQALSERPGYGGKPSRVIPPGVDLERFRPDAAGGAELRRRLGWPADAIVVGYLGRFIEAKGLPRLTRALGACRMDWRALFVGGGPLERELGAFAARFEGRVHVQTGVPHDEVPTWVNAMSMLCAPSQTTTAWREQFGRMLIEAMACGVPVVASDSGEMPFVVGDAGTIAGEHDDAGWTAAIDRLAGDEALRRSLGARGLERVRERFAWPTVARQHLAFFDEVRRS
jgi:glycosyltransferase involved in cell wall biosynthesis